MTGKLRRIACIMEFAITILSFAIPAQAAGHSHCVCCSTSNNPFTDVAQGKFYYDAVLWAAESGVTTGMTATTFAPNNACTRGQIVTFLYRALAMKK